MNKINLTKQEAKLIIELLEKGFPYSEEKRKILASIYQRLKTLIK